MAEQGQLTTLTLEELNKNGDHFFIPAYQRGYRWTTDQAEDLVRDLNEHFASNVSEKYSLQPLVVKWHEDENHYEVIDGQQRLTTIFMLLAANGIKPNFTIEYETRPGSKDYLEDLKDALMENAEILPERESNADYDHMHAIAEFLRKPKNHLIGHHLDRVAFIWAPLHSKESSKERFKSMNAWKVNLTEAELIKAILLNGANFASDHASQLIRRDIAKSWDRIEQKLQNHDLWYFLVNKKSAQDGFETRIELIFDLIVSKEESAENDPSMRLNHRIAKILKQRAEDAEDKEVEVNGALIRSFWKEEVEGAIDRLSSWYDDFELYHLAGFLLATDAKLAELYSETSRMKRSELLTHWYKECLKRIGIAVESNDKQKKPPIELIESKESLVKRLKDAEYAKGGRYSYNTLLAHNVFLILKLNGEQKGTKFLEGAKFSRGTKFSFIGYKATEYDVEHIEPNSGGKSWRDGLGNLTLLDSTINRAYGKADYDVKKAVIVSSEEDGFYVLPDSKNVFLRTYREPKKRQKRLFDILIDGLRFDRTYTFHRIDKSEWKDDFNTWHKVHPNLAKGLKWNNNDQSTLTQVFKRGMAAWDATDAQAHLDEIAGTLWWVIQNAKGATNGH